MQPNVPEFVDHVALWMPMLVLAVAKYFDKLFQYRSLTSIATLRKFSRVMVMAVNISIVLVVAVLCAKNGRANRTSKMLNMIFPVKSSDVRSSQRTIARMT